MTASRRILLAEDNEPDIELTIEALRDHHIANEIDVVRDGSQALEYLYCRNAYASRDTGNPALILLDIKMPKVDGLEVLKQVKTDDRLKMIPVVMLTSSRQERDLLESYKLGVNAYVVKPVKFNEFIDAVSTLGIFWMLINESL